MRVAIIGGHEILYDIATRVSEAGDEIKTVITAKSRPKYKVSEKDFEGLARRLNASFFYKRPLDDVEVEREISGLDIGISLNWPYIIQEETIRKFKLGILNSHMGELPKYRGNACANWAILMWEDSIGFTVYLMEGKIRLQENYCRKQIWIRKGYIHRGCLCAARENFPNSTIKALNLLKDDESYTLRYASLEDPSCLGCYPRRPEDSLINWSSSSESIYRLVRASSRPFSGAYSFLEGEKITIWSAEPLMMEKDI